MTAREARVEVPFLDGGSTFVVPRMKHPAVYSDSIVEIMARELAERPWPGKLVLDPFAGQGVKLEAIRTRSERAFTTTGVEIEAEWAACAPFGAVLVGDSTKLPPKWSNRFGAVVTSPCYGNRFADSHVPKDKCSKCGGSGEYRVPNTKPVECRVCDKCKGDGLSPRRSYTHDLGRKLTDGSAGAMHYGDAYRELHRAVYGEVVRVLKPGGVFLLNVKDHVRGGKRVRVCEWTRRTIVKVGLVQEAAIVVRPPGLRFGANSKARVGNEIVYAFRKPEA